MPTRGIEPRTSGLQDLRFTTELYGQSKCSSVEICHLYLHNCLLSAFRKLFKVAIPKDAATQRIHVSVSMNSSKLHCQHVCAHIHSAARLRWGKHAFRCLDARDPDFGLVRQGLAARGGIVNTPMYKCCRIQLKVYTRVTGLNQHRSSAYIHVHNVVSCCARAAKTESSDTATQAVTSAPNVAVLDKLIAVFSSKSPTEWRKLIAHSKQWPQLSGSVLARYAIKSEDTVYAILTSAIALLHSCQSNAFKSS